MKITFFGSSSFSIPVLKALLSSEHSVAQVVSTPDKKQGRGQKLGFSVVKTFALEQNLPILTPEKLSLPSVAESIKKREPDFMIVASYGKLIPSTIFKISRIAPLNVHPSLLPKYRGASPIQQAILEGDQNTGVSIAGITSELDAGDVFAQAETRIGENENAHELEKRLSEIGAKLVLDVIKQFETGEILRKAQDSLKATYAKKIVRDSGRIDWTKSAANIHNQVRAFYPWPSAFTFFHGKRLKILETRKTNETTNMKRTGTIIKIDKDKGLYVETGTGPLALVHVQLEGRKEMSAFDFAIGQRVQKGEQFESL